MSRPVRRRRVGCAAVAALAIVTSGCGPAVPDYRTVWSTSAAPTSSSSSAAPSEPFSKYLEDHGVTGRPIAPEKLTDLSVTMPTPPGWTPYEDTKLAPGTRAIEKGNTYPAAMLLVFELTGAFDPAEAIKHADADALRSPAFKKLNGSLADHDGFPSSMIEGSYDLNGTRMQSYNRVVIATLGSAQPERPAPRYLIQLTVTSFADQARADGPDVESIISGFHVRPK